MAASSFWRRSDNGVQLIYIEGFAGSDQCRSRAQEAARVLEVVEFSREGFAPDADEPPQAVLRSKAKRGILNCQV